MYCGSGGCGCINKSESHYGELYHIWLKQPHEKEAQQSAECHTYQLSKLFHSLYEIGFVLEIHECCVQSYKR